MKYEDAITLLRSKAKDAKRLSPEDLGSAQKQLDCAFPEEYQSLLNTLGSCSLFADHPSGSIQIIDPLQVRDVFQDSFDDVEGWIGSRVLPVGFDNRLQEIAAYVWNRPRGANFVVMSHEYYLDDLWDYFEEDEAMWFRTLGDWVIQIAECDGEMGVH